MPPRIAIGEESPLLPECRALLSKSDAHANALYPPASNHLVDAEALVAERVRFFVARVDAAVAGCGGLRPKPGYGEIKRMFVLDAARGLGVGRALLNAIEAAARGAGLALLRLETGTRNHEALRLYHAAGFREIGPFGEYGPDPLSVFMEKSLSAA